MTKLAGGVAVIKVGRRTNEMKEKKARVEERDATPGAVEEGIVRRRLEFGARLLETSEGDNRSGSRHKVVLRALKTDAQDRPNAETSLSGFTRWQGRAIRFNAETGIGDLVDRGSRPTMVRACAANAGRLQA